MGSVEDETEAARRLTARAEAAEAKYRALREGLVELAEGARALHDVEWHVALRALLASAPAAPERRARILVTGSRDWTDAETIRRALSEAWHTLGRPHDATLVHGQCHLGGADEIAAEVWAGWGYPVEGHPAEMGPNGRVLGPKRNAHMVNLGANLCLAFPLPSSRGTRNCMRLAREAGIPVREFHQRAQISTPTPRGSA